MIKTPEDSSEVLYRFFLLTMYLSEGNNNVFTHIFGKLALIAGHADYKIHMELLADFLNLFDNLLDRKSVV